MEKTESTIDSSSRKARHEKEKARLHEYRHLLREREQIEAMLEEIEAAMSAPKVQRLDGMPRGGTPDGGSAIETLAAKHIELQQRYQEKLVALAAKQLEIEQDIEALPSREKMLLRLYYIQGKTWEQVCVEMSYCWRQVHRIHSSALDLLEKRKEPEA